MTKEEQIQAWKDANPEGVWGFGFFNDDFQQMIADNPNANGIRIVFGLENGVQQAYLEPACLPCTKEALMSTMTSTGGGLPCPTYCK